MPRKDIDLTDQHIAQLDTVRAERRVTYSEVVRASLDAYFAPKPEPLPQNITERLWSLDSASQKTAERLAAIETQMDGMHESLGQSMELLILIGERLANNLVDVIQPTLPAEPANTSAPTITDETPHVDDYKAPHTEMFTNPESPWYIPPEPPTEKRPWYRRSKS